MTAKLYLSKMGGRFRHLNDWARKIAIRFEQRNAVLLTEYVPSKKNPADFFSRCLNAKSATKLDKEWALDARIFTQVCNDLCFVPTIDVFASSWNFQVPRFCSLEGFQVSEFFDAFLISWENENLYLFPPFNLLPRVLSRIIEGQYPALLIHPRWETQAWWSLIIQNRSAFRNLPKVPHLLRLPQAPRLLHRLAMKLSLQASLFSWD